MLDYLIKVNKTYYLETLLNEFKDEIKNNKMNNLINDHLDISSSGKEFDNESDNGEN